MGKAKHETVSLGRQESAEIKFALIKKPARHETVTYAKRSAETKSTVDDWLRRAKHKSVI